MAIQRFRLNLGNASFPLLSTKAARAVMTPGLDQQTQRTQTGVEQANAPYTQAQVLYMEDVMPVREGYVSTVSGVAMLPKSPGGFDTVHVLRDLNSDPVLFSPGAGQNYIATKPAGSAAPVWNKYPFSSGILLPPPIEPTSPNTAATATVTTAVVEGRSFICYSRITSGLGRSYTFTGTYVSAGTTTLVIRISLNGTDYNYTLGTNAELTVSGDNWTLAIPSIALPWGTATIYTIRNGSIASSYLRIVGTDLSLLELTALTLPLPATSVSNIPFDPGTIDGVATSNGYLLLWSDLTVAWAPFSGASNTFDYTIYSNGNFTGAGYQIPQDVNSRITAIVGTSGGFVIFTDELAVAAHYQSNNPQSPWVFRRIPGAGGVTGPQQVTQDTGSGRMYAITTAGIQRISLNSAETMFEELTNYMEGGVYETYAADGSNNNIVKITSTLQRFTATVSCVSDRYLVFNVQLNVSTTPGYYKEQLIYDLALQRWGKRRYNAADVFTYPFGVTTAEESMATVEPGGYVLRIKFREYRSDIDQSVGTGRLVLGKIQLHRSRNVQLSRVELENMHDTYDSVSILPSATGGATTTGTYLTEINSPGSGHQCRTYGGLIDCKNFLLSISGNFRLSTVVLEASTSGMV
jgi:hypothetical protein